MHWVVNTCLRREGGYDALIYNLDRQEIPYTLVRKPPFADYLVGMEDDIPMMLDIEGPVFVTGTTSMREVSYNHLWYPGYIDAPSNQECLKHWGEHMLNHDMMIGPIGSIVPPDGDFFIRPNEDTKSFAGTIMSAVELDYWRQKLDAISIDGYTTIPPETEVVISSVKKIWSEYRCAVVNGRVVTASRYKTGRTVAYNQDVGDRIINFANERIKEWNPRSAVVLDIADTPEGLKVIETNAISSSGFYAMDMGIFVHEISQLMNK